VRDLSLLADLPHLSSLDLRGCGRTIRASPCASWLGSRSSQLSGRAATREGAAHQPGRAWASLPRPRAAILATRRMASSGRRPALSHDRASVDLDLLRSKL